jgi:parvulin-like peptidyl-prolyl isomerase
VTPERRARALLALGAAAGLAVAVGSILRDGPGDALAPDVLATVNGVPIRGDDYLRALAAVAEDRRTPVDQAEKRRILDRLIEEELLVQRGIELGLVRRERTVRASLVAATIDLLAGAGGGEETADDLRAFYDTHRDYFADPGRLRVRQVLVRAQGRGEDDARARADDAARRLRAGEPFEEVRRALGDEEVAPLPDTALPAAKLREYVGETAARAAFERAAGETTDPVRSSMGFHVLQVVERTPPSVAPFEQVTELVRSELRRRADDATLRAALASLRRAADVQAVEALP